MPSSSQRRSNIRYAKPELSHRAESMDDLLKAYELEIVQLRLLSGEFARRYPKVAGKLQIAGDGCEDPMSSA